jgi:hypothetical protein
MDQLRTTSRALLITQLRPVAGAGELGARLAVASHMDRASAPIEEILFPRPGRRAAVARVPLAEPVFMTEG